MTIPELQALTRKTLDFGIQRIRETGEVHQQFHLVSRERIEIVVLTGSITNSEAAKDDFAEYLRERAGGQDLEAIIMLSDTYVTHDMTEAADAIRRTFGMTIEQAAKAGMCTVQEAIIASLESPIYGEIMQQEYRRTDGARAIELVGEPTVKGLPKGGRFMNLFMKQPGATQ